MTSLKATLLFGVPRNDDSNGDVESGTLVGYLARAAPSERGLIDLDDTVDGASIGGVAAYASNVSITDMRTTVLPRRAKSDDGEPRHIVEQRPRFDRVRRLGEGAVGTVELARDNDIRRTVAVKKLRADVRSPGSLLRFADEVRIVGQLEHPSIVPIYDVGKDESGDVYLVMKHLDGETMEEVIEKLRAGDPAYVARFSPQFRAHLFLSVLDAIRYAHSRGILHRDLKPANIMIGRYDEVTVMDWGIAKPLGKRDSAASEPSIARSWLDSADHRLLETQMGTLAGTPLYMSPEQAAGMNDSLDERSDVYALALVFYEWLTLSHPLEGKSTLIEVLASVITQDYDRRTLLRRAADVGVPCEYVYLVARGLERDRERRLSSAAVMYDELKAILEGRVEVQCAVTLTKRVTHDGLRWVDHHPAAAITTLVLGAVSMLVGVGTLVALAVRAFL